MSQTYEKITETVSAIKEFAPVEPDYGIILGTGLGKLADRIENETIIPYNKLPYFPEPTVEAHKGRLIIGDFAGKKVMAMQGRYHLYEGYSLWDVVFPVRVMKFCGIDSLFVSNAAGGVNPEFPAGTLMAITDHINLLGDNPLIGPNDDRIGPRFPDMSEPYSREYIDLALSVAKQEKIRVEKGVYASMSGPCLETKAEYRMLKTLGADAVGMSTVPEVIAAVHAGMKVFGLSVITDNCLPDALEPVDIEKIIAIANEAEPKLIKLIEKVIKEL